MDKWILDCLNIVLEDRCHDWALEINENHETKVAAVNITSERKIRKVAHTLYLRIFVNRSTILMFVHQESITTKRIL